MSKVDSTFYSNITQPSRTRSGAIPIEGFPLEKRRLSYKDIVDPARRVCNSQGFRASKLQDADADAGKYYYIYVDPYDASPNMTCVIDEVSPLLVNPTEFETGAYYTYMVASSSSSDIQGNAQPQLYAAKTVNMYEFGTKHQQIMYRKARQDTTAEYKIYATGEIMCVNENTLLFNFISGTYKMKRHISARRAKYEQAYITYMMRNIAPKYMNILFQKEVLITDDVLPLTRQELSRLRRHNIPLFMFDTQTQCTWMNGDVIQHKRKMTNITDEEMKSIYVKIRSYYT
jgi:hypothetical protein